ncbi:TIGR01440 family protein [Haloplasma contractile]|uniref:Uncharacterized protein n=1 Tax=Haloplasma contractile SSD-17B TaxID=1033810 RepID=U2DY54_9MOLU|nr:TIGR01440 family protein [Haloplasma contractile]ERJ13192.1 hypothetical protein HLPCO_000811 [Haloplasma contractile SSD-17B]
MEYKNELKKILDEFQEMITIKPNQIMVVGCSTSEIIGERIGTAGSLDVGSALYDVFKQFSKETGLDLAFQCCEHLNRALVVERDVQYRLQLDEVTAVPIVKAGGSMATQAYKRYTNPCVVEHIKADYGIDIGDTLIGMHLKHVAVPVRTSIKELGHAHVTLAKTRPKLIGGERAVYCVSDC